MRHIVSTSALNEGGEFYWLRITSFTAGATLSIDNEKPFTIDSLAGYTSPFPTGKAWRNLAGTGVVTLEVGTDPFEPYPGPVNGPATAAPAIINPATSLTSATLIAGQDTADSAITAFSAPIDGKSIAAATDAGFPQMLRVDSGTGFFRWQLGDVSGRARQAPRGSDWAVTAQGVAAPSVNTVATAGLVKVLLGGTVSMAGQTAVGQALATLTDNNNGVIWQALLGGGAASQSSISIPPGLASSVGGTLTLTFTSIPAGATQSVAMNGTQQTGL